MTETNKRWPEYFRDLSTILYTIAFQDYALFYVTFSAHRDPDIFPNSNQFLPERWST